MSTREVCGGAGHSISCKHRVILTHTVLLVLNVANEHQRGVWQCWLRNLMQNDGEDWITLNLASWCRG